MKAMYVMLYHYSSPDSAGAHPVDAALALFVAKPQGRGVPEKEAET
ncbi:hypothetical protein [Novosphingobium panipatense]|nr:hypothetical protein [Novosphingobium panipatense]